jgi:hypothetical protein
VIARPILPVLNEGWRLTPIFVVERHIYKQHVPQVLPPDHDIPITPEPCNWTTGVESAPESAPHSKTTAFARHLAAKCLCDGYAFFTPYKEHVLSLHIKTSETLYLRYAKVP